jgi:hypothetical protein
MGDTISYADITIAAWILWIKKIFGSDSKEPPLSPTSKAGRVLLHEAYL